MTVLDKITMLPLPETQYMGTPTNKRQIYLHHTAGSSNPYGVIEYWARTPPRIGTALIVGGKPPTRNTSWKDGDIYQAFSTRNWGYHLGLKTRDLPAGSKTSTSLEKGSVGIEICNFGPVKPIRDGNFRNYVGGVMKASEVTDLGFTYRGHRWWHSYTDAQIESTRELLLYLCNRWDIPSTFKGMEIFDFSARACAGEPGIWSHTSVRKDKTDVYPHPKLIEMLKTL